MLIRGRLVEEFASSLHLVAAYSWGLGRMIQWSWYLQTRWKGKGRQDDDIRAIITLVFNARVDPRSRPFAVTNLPKNRDNVWMSRPM